MKTQPLLTIICDGDDVEKRAWPVLQDLVLHYETFWQFYVVPLRNPVGISLRPGIDRGFEKMAISNYSMYGALAKAYEEFTKPEEELAVVDIYAALYRAKEVAVKTVEEFLKIYDDCTGNKKIPTEALGAMERLRTYRNLIHDRLPGSIMPSVAHGVVPGSEDEYNVFRINVDGIVVRYVQGMWSIQMTVEGVLPQQTIDLLCSELLETLAALENTTCERSRL